jgi:uncharacterized protein YdcH (DUF465 family)
MDESRIAQLWDRQDKLEERIRLVENQQAGTIIYVKEIKEDLQEIKEELKKIKPSDITSQQNKLWQSDVGKLLIKTGCIIAVLLTGAAIGVNYFDKYLAAVMK